MKKFCRDTCGGVIVDCVVLTVVVVGVGIAFWGLLSSAVDLFGHDNPAVEEQLENPLAE